MNLNFRDRSHITSSRRRGGVGGFWGNAYPRVWGGRGGRLTNDYPGEDIVQNGQKGDDLICE